MSKHKLILKEAELVDLITYTVLDIQEQRIGYDVMIDAQHKRDYGGDDSGSSVLGDWWEKLKSYYDPGSEDSYHHGINQSLAIVFYAAGAIILYFGKTPAHKALGAEFEVIAILIEMIDFQQYMDEGDYYNAGLVAAFVWFPIGRLSVKGLKTLFPKIFQQAVNKFIKLKQTPKQCFDYLIRTQGQKFVGKLSLVMKNFPDLIKSLSSAADKVSKFVKDLNKLLTNQPWWLPDAMVGKLRGVIQTILKPLYVVIKFLLVILGSIAAYDPAIIAPLFGWAGRKWDITSFNNVEEWLEDLAEKGVTGVNIWNSILEKSGSVDGAITTTRVDCDLGFYVWDDVVESFKKTHYHTNVISSHGNKKDGVNLTILWDKWQEGWRPDIKMSDVNFDITSDDLNN